MTGDLQGVVLGERCDGGALKGNIGWRCNMSAKVLLYSAGGASDHHRFLFRWAGHWRGGREES